MQELFGKCGFWTLQRYYLAPKMHNQNKFLKNHINDTCITQRLPVYKLYIKFGLSMMSWLINTLFCFGHSICFLLHYMGMNWPEQNRICIDQDFHTYLFIFLVLCHQGRWKNVLESEIKKNHKWWLPSAR